MAETVTDTSRVTAAAPVTTTGVANTAKVLGGSGTAAKSGKQAAPQPALWTGARGKADALAWANEVMKKDLRLASTNVRWFTATAHKDAHPVTGNPPHPGLEKCDFGAWTNSGTTVYLFDVLWSQIEGKQSGSVQRVNLWATILHESSHARVFKNTWGGSHPPSLEVGFFHEWQVYWFTAKMLGKPSHRRIKNLILDPAAKTELEAQKAQGESQVNLFEQWFKNEEPALKGMTKSQREIAFLGFFAGSFPPRLENQKPPLSPDEIVKRSYGY